MKTKAKHVNKNRRKLPAHSTVALNVLVNRKLRDRANKAREKLSMTWVEIVERSLHATIAAAGMGVKS